MDGSLRTVQASDGYALTFRHWRPASTRATVVLLNGIMSNSAWFGPLVEPLLAGGLELIGADRRGSGRNRQGWGDAPSAAQLVQDVATIVEEVDADGPLFMLGWCWGASLAVAATRTLGQRVAGLILVTPGMFSSEAIVEAMAAQQRQMTTAPLDRAVIDSPIREGWFTQGPALQNFILQDSDRVLKMTPRMVEISRKLVVSALARLPALPVPMLVLLANDDQATDNEATRRALQRVPAERIEVRELASKHGIQFDAPHEVAAAIGEFVQPRASPP